MIDSQKERTHDRHYWLTANSMRTAQQSPLPDASCRRGNVVRFALAGVLGAFLFVIAAAPAWCAIAIDASVSTNRSSSSTSIASPSFSTASANELLLAFIAADAKSSGMTVTGVTGGSLTWALVRRTNTQLGTAEIWRAFASARLSGATVQATLSQSVAATITVISFTGTDTSGTSGSGAIGATGSGNANPGAPTASLVTTRNNSWVFGVGCDWDNATQRTLGPNQTMVNQYLATVGDTYWVQRQNAPTAASGTTVTINDTAPSTDRYNLTIVEVLPAPVSGSTYTVSGSITPSSLASGATVTLGQSGTTIASATVDASGNYSFASVANGTYTVTPGKSGYTFSPASQSVTVNGSAVTVPAFTAAAVPTWTVSGTISPAASGSGTLLTLTGGTVLTTTADSSGNYTFTGLANGTYTVTPGKSGYAFSPSSLSVPVNNANVTGANFTASLLSTGPEPTGWYAGDMHVHRSCGGPPETLSAMLQRMAPENLSVISLLADMGNGEVQNPTTDLPLVNGQNDPVSTSNQFVHWDAEWHWDPTYTQYPHNALGGHIVALGLTQASQVWQEYTYPIFQWAHQRNGIAGFAHMQYLDGTNTIANGLTCCTPVEYPVEVALGSADFISEDVSDAGSTCQGAASPGVSAPLYPENAIQAYYKLLNCGFRPGFAGGTDYPCNCSDPLGSILTYAQVAGGQMTYSNWIQGIATGRTVVSRNGHNEFLSLTVNNTATPGDEVKLAAAGSVPVTIQWTANQSLTGTIELVQNGVVVASKAASASSGSPASLTTTVNFAHSGWLAARRMDSSLGHMVHTAAVFVTVNNEPVRASAADAQFYVGWMDNLLTKTSPGGPWNQYFPTNLAAAQARYTAAKTLYQQIAADAAALFNVTTTTLPNGAQGVSYSAALTASGGVSPYTWSIAGGALPPGLSLNSGTGTIAGTPTAVGTFGFTVQATDSSIPAKTATASLSITVTAQASYSLWPATTVPGLADGGADNPVELGVKFRSDSNGYINGIRFYKASTNTGTHVANLWTSAGALLATATFSNETASGWQQVNFTAPVAITANTVYVASYHANNGHYSADVNYFATAGVDNPPLHALPNGVSGGNGVYLYGASSGFPNQTWNSANYWVDVAFSPSQPPALASIAVTPASQTIATGATQQFTATGTYSDNSTQNLTSQATWASSATGVATINSSALAMGVSPGSTTISASLGGITGGTSLTVQAYPPTITTTSLPAGILNTQYATTLSASGGTLPYTWSIASGSLPQGLSLNTATGVISGTPTAGGGSSFVVQVSDSGSPVQTATKSLSIAIATGASSPILIISSTSNPFSSYYAEMLRAEGFNEFAMNDVSTVSSAVLAAYDIVILGDIALTTDQATMLSTWVNAGGHLIAMHPDKKLAGLLGLTDQSLALANAYLLVSTSSGPGAGIVNQTIQYHGTADQYSLNGATAIATLYSTATASTSSPAVTLNSVGSSGGKAAAFTYDLARSVIYTRQGNPAWSGQERDGISPIRSDDLYYGSASFDQEPDWVNLDKAAIPQADEQQRLLANMIIQMNYDKKPLPRFWYFPRSLAAVVVMTGDDHGSMYNGGATAARFDQYIADSPQGCVVDNWECVRSTAYLFPPIVASNPLTDSQAASYMSAGFEIGVHVDSNPDCSDWTPSSLDAAYTNDISSFASKYTSAPAPRTHRMHCVSWSDYDSQPKVEFGHGIRLDTTYYYWPQSWINDRPGFLTGSGMPMRFTDINGNILDIYQAATQMTDESGQSYPSTIDTLLNNAIGATGYYGVFTANMHNDVAASTGADAIVSSAQAHGIPVVSASQMLTWLDGRNGSTISTLAWNGTTLSFSISVGQGANGLTAMVPVPDSYTVTGVTLNGSPVSYSVRTIKGITYAVFAAASGACQVTYTVDTTPPTVLSVSPANSASGVSIGTTVTALFSEAIDPATVNTVSMQLTGPTSTVVPATVTYDGGSKSATLDPAALLAASTAYTATVKGGAGGVTDLAGNPLITDFIWSFTTAASSPPTLDKAVTANQSSGASTINSPGISTAQPNELLVAFIATDGPSTGGTQRIASVAGGGLTWTLRSRANAQAGTAEIWTAPAANTLSNVVVTATLATGAYQGMMTVAAFQGASMTANGAVANASASTGAPQVTLTTTRANSLVWGIGDDWDNAISRTLGSGQTKQSEFLAPAGDTFWVQYRTAPSSAAGAAATISCTAPTNDRWNLAILEIVPQ